MTYKMHSGLAFSLKCKTLRQGVSIFPSILFLLKTLRQHIYIILPDDFPFPDKKIKYYTLKETHYTFPNQVPNTNSENNHLSQAEILSSSSVMLSFHLVNN